jgi:type VI secretion system protein ImpK
MLRAAVIRIMRTMNDTGLHRRTSVNAPLTPAASAPSAWPPAVLSRIESELARFVGPLAEMLVRRAAPHHNTIDALVAALLPSIEGHADRDAFSRVCAQRAATREAVAAPALMPTPATALPPAAPAAAWRAPSRPSPTVRTANPLLGAADALLETLPRLRALTGHTHPAVLQAQLLEQVAVFEAEATVGGVSRLHIDAARGLLCSFVDEVITATPWGARGGWARHSLTQVHSAGQDPFDLLQGLFDDPAAHAPLLELFYVCLALGFEGRLRNTPHARTLLDALMARLRGLLPTHGTEPAASRTLSPHWQGQTTIGHRDLALLPLWAVFAVAGVLLLALWLVLNARLDARAHPVFSRIAAAPAALQGNKASAAAKPRLLAALPASATDSDIEVRDEAQRSVVTLPADTLFAEGTARLTPRGHELLSRVALALRSPAGELRGDVLVIGHGDDTAPPSLQFPSSWHFTRARAQTVADALIALRVAPARAEGRAEFDPRAPNTTPAGRAQNRRIDIELRLRRPDEVTTP